MLIQGELCITHAYCRVLTVEWQLFDYAHNHEALGAQRLEMPAGDERGCQFESQLRETFSSVFKVPLNEALSPPLLLSGQQWKTVVRLSSFQL